MTRLSRLLAFGFLVAALAGCTATRPPSYQLPEKEGLVPGETVIVGRNENVYSIAHKNGVSMREMIVLNDLQPPFIVKPGQRLVLPAGGGAASSGYSGTSSYGYKGRDVAPAPSAAPLGSIQQAPLAGSSVSGSGNDAVTSTPLAPPSAAAAAPSDAVGFSAPRASASSSNLAAPTPLVAPQPAEQSRAAAPSAAPFSAPSAALSPKEAASKAVAAGTFAWPVQGTVLSSFGSSKGQGQDNDGVNIAAPKGSPVVAADGGIVVYAGDEMKGFGNLILVRHEGGWVTAYAHLDRVLVSKDGIVAPGDMIGTVGTSGGVSAPQLHFETRLDGKPVDPETVLKK